MKLNWSNDIPVYLNNNRVEAFRVSRNLSKAQFAKAMGRSGATMSNFYNGGKMTYASAIRIMGLINAPFKDLFTHRPPISQG